MTTAATEEPKDKGKDRVVDEPARDDFVVERGDSSGSLIDHRHGRHEGHDSGTEEREDDPTVEDADAKARRLSNTHHGHVLTALRRLHAGLEDGGMVSREELGEVLEMMEAAHSHPVPQPESGSTVHGTTGPGAPPDIHHTPFASIERHRQPGQ